MKLVPLERNTTQTLLGIRFWDRVTNRVIADGLQVRAQRLSSDRTQRLGKPVVGQMTPSGAIAFFGIATGEIPAADSTQQLWETIPPEELVVIDLVDRLERFLPMSFVARLPFRGVFRGQGDWLGTSLLRPEVGSNAAIGVQLWSAPTRSVLPGQAVIRAQIAIGSGDTPPPAAYALVRVQQPSSDFDYYGMTDRQGTLLLPMPYPAIPDPATPDTPYPSLDQQTFALTITIGYEISPSILPNSTVPNLESLLSQPPANIAIHHMSEPTPGLQLQPNLSVNLQFGHPLILRTALNPEADAMESVLRIQST